MPARSKAYIATGGEHQVSKDWFETVAEAQRRAKKRLPKSVYSALIAGTEKGQTTADNLAAFDELEIAPHVVGLLAERDLATTVMGQPIAFPVIISPTGVQAVHPDGEVAVARAAAARGTAIGLSSFASKPLTDVVAANPQTFFQAHWVGSREEILARAERARTAGALGLIITLDWSFSCTYPPPGPGPSNGTTCSPQRPGHPARHNKQPRRQARPETPSGEAEHTGSIRTPEPRSATTMINYA